MIKMRVMQLSEKMLAAAAGWAVVHEARKIRDAGRVLRAEYEPPLLKGAVRSGSKTYATGLRMGSVMENLCSCSDSWMEGKICAHSVATALVIMGARDAGRLPTSCSQTLPKADDQ